MSSKQVAKTVAKKFDQEVNPEERKFYLDVTRREDGFDLSGPYLPQEDPTPLRAGPTLAYDGIHDRSLKHYFHNDTVKKQLQHMTVPPNMHRRRERAIRKYVDETMATVDYRLKAGPISPYAFPQTFRPVPPPHRPKALRTVDEYFRTKRGSRRRKLPSNIVGKPRRITRRSPPQHVHKDERERIVNMASKLIVATETVALPQQKKQSKGFQASDKEFPRLERRSSRSAESSTESAFTSGHESEGSINGRTPCPPKREKPKSASYRRRPQSSFFKSSSFDNPRPSSGVHVMLPNDSQNDREKMRDLMDRMNLDGRGTSVMASPRDLSKRPKSAVYPLKSTATTGVDTDLPDYSDDEFYSDNETPKDSTRTPRVSAWSTNDDMVDMCTQTVVHSGTQTKFPELEDPQQEREVILPKTLSWVDSTDVVASKPPVAVATTGASTADVLTSTSHETQTRNRDLEPKVITYEVYVQTGDRLGAGSKVNVKITLFGEYGNSGERQLLRSRTHRNKFQRGQVDVFAIDSLFLGKLQSIRIGHNETRLGYGWFLDTVYIKEGVDATRSFEFRCNRWLSSRDDDGQIMRDLPLYDIVPASHAEAILPKEQHRDEFYSPGESNSSLSESEETPRDVEPRVHETTRTKSKKKTPTSKTKSKAKSTAEDEDEIDGFKGTKAENLFEVADDDEEEEENEDRFFDPDGEYESERSDEEHIVDRKEPKTDNKVARFKKVGKETSKERRREKESNEEEEEKEQPKEIKKSEKKPLRFSHVKTAALTSRLSQPPLSAKQEVESEEKERESDEQRRDKKKKLANVTAVMRAANKMPMKQQVKENTEVEKEEESESEEEQEENEQVNEQEEEQSEEEQEEKEEEQPAKAPKGAGHLRVITTALSPFLKNRAASKKEPVPPSPIPEEPPELPEEEPKKTEEPEEKTRDSDDDEPAVEFTKEEQKKPERPISARSDEYDEGFRAGIRQKHEEERKRHKQSITESESILKSGQDIHDAAKAGNLARIKELIQAVPSMKSVHNEKGMTPLHVAASNGHLDCVKWLAVSGVDLADETPTGYTAMHLAAMNGHVNCMMILAAMGSMVSCKTVDNFTPLHLAAMSGHIECVKWLLANRCQVDVEDMNGRTALDIAEEYGHEAIQKLLQKFKKELTRQDSTLAQLMKAEKRRKSIDSTSDNDVAPSKVSDSGVGGMESEEDNWMSDAEEDAQAEDSKSVERKASTSSRDRPDSASRSRTDSIVTVEDKKKLFEQQRRKMKKRHSSFLDSIRMDVDNPEQEEF